jgi:hypothetical protein
LNFDSKKFLLSWLISSQIWLIPLVDDRPVHPMDKIGEKKPWLAEPRNLLSPVSPPPNAWHSGPLGYVR